MQPTLDPIIPLARVVREHGFLRSGVFTFKADLFSTGGEIFKKVTKLWVGRGAFVGTHHPERIDWVPLKLAATPAPHGGAWGQARAILLKVPESQVLAPGDAIGVARSQFPTLTKGFYLCDLMGRTLVNEHESIVGTLVAFQEVAPSCVNLRVKTPSGESFEFPASWIDDKAIDEKLPLKVEGIDQWMLDSKAKPDDIG